MIESIERESLVNTAVQITIIEVVKWKAKINIDWLYDSKLFETRVRRMNMNHTKSEDTNQG